MGAHLHEIFLCYFQCGAFDPKCEELGHCKASQICFLLFWNHIEFLALTSFKVSITPCLSCCCLCSKRLELHAGTSCVRFGASFLQLSKVLGWSWCLLQTRELYLKLTPWIISILKVGFCVFFCLVVYSSSLNIGWVVLMEYFKM